MLNNTIDNPPYDSHPQAIRLSPEFTVEPASLDDLTCILAIYNQSIAGKQATANLTEVTVEERLSWFKEHLDNPTRPIYVIKTCCTKNNAKERLAPIIVAWGSFSDLYARHAYHISSEISIYLHSDYHQRGLGSLLLNWMLTQAPKLSIRNIVALVFAHNEPSLKLFHKLGFEQWGYMPQVCDMDGFIADVVMLAKTLPIENSIADQP